MNKLFKLLLTLIIVTSLNGMEEKSLKIKDSALFRRNNVKDVELFHNNRGFHVLEDGKLYPVEKHEMNPILRTLKHKQLKKFQKNGGYIHIKKIDDGKFTLQSKVRGDGGGIVTGWFLYGLTKTLCYGTAAAAVGGAVAATGGAVVAAAGAIGGASAATVAGSAYTGVVIAGGKAVAGTTIGVAMSTTPVAIVAGGISATAGGTAAATTATAAVVTSAGSIGAAVAMVETASCGAFALGCAAWFLP